MNNHFTAETEFVVKKLEGLDEVVFLGVFTLTKEMCDDVGYGTPGSEFRWNVRLPMSDFRTGIWDKVESNE